MCFFSKKIIDYGLNTNISDNPNNYKLVDNKVQSVPAGNFTATLATQQCKELKAWVYRKFVNIRPYVLKEIKVRGNILFSTFFENLKFNKF